MGNLYLPIKNLLIYKKMQKKAILYVLNAKKKNQNLKELERIGTGVKVVIENTQTKDLKRSATINYGKISIFLLYYITNQRCFMSIKNYGGALKLKDINKEVQTSLDKYIPYKCPIGHDEYTNDCPSCKTLYGTQRRNYNT